MKTYRVRVSENYVGYVDVEANSRDDAIAEVERQIDAAEYFVPNDMSADLNRKCSIVRVVKGQCA